MFLFKIISGHTCTGDPPPFPRQVQAEPQEYYENGTESKFFNQKFCNPDEFYSRTIGITLFIIQNILFSTVVFERIY